MTLSGVFALDETFLALREAGERMGAEVRELTPLRDARYLLIGGGQAKDEPLLASMAVEWRRGLIKATVSAGCYRPADHASSS
jgi:hypothetical protein